MKKLMTSDLFAAFRIVKAGQIRDRLIPLINKFSEGNTSVKAAGIETILVIMEGLCETRSETALYEFLASPFEMTAEEVAQLPPAELLEKLKQLSEENDLNTFFSQLVGLITSRSST